jgi:hypothetical protein
VCLTVIAGLVEETNVPLELDAEGDVGPSRKAVIWSVLLMVEVRSDLVLLRFVR